MFGMKWLERFIYLLAAGVTLIFFTTGMDLAEFMERLRSFFGTLRMSAIPEEREIAEADMASILLAWAALTMFFAGIAAVAQPRGYRLRAFLKGVVFFPLLAMVIVVPAFLLKNEEAQRFGILAGCCGIVMMVFLCGLAKHINKLGRWPKSVSENILILGFMISVPMLPFSWLGIIILILSMCLAAALSPKFVPRSQQIGERYPTPDRCDDKTKIGKKE